MDMNNKEFKKVLGNLEKFIINNQSKLTEKDFKIVTDALADFKETCMKKIEKVN